MNALSPDAVRARISAIRQRVERSRDDNWAHELTADADCIVLKRAVFDSAGKKSGHEAPSVLCTFGAGATRWEKEIVRDAVEDLAFVLDQLTAAGRMLREQRAELSARRTDTRSGVPDTTDGASGKNYAAEAAMKCNETSFQTYLRERHATDDDGDLTDSANAAAVQRRALKIGARSELNTDPDAAARWRDMRADFQAWGQS